jgi:hypothetical protein
VPAWSGGPTDVRSRRGRRGTLRRRSSPGMSRSRSTCRGTRGSRPRA